MDSLFTCSFTETLAVSAGCLLHSWRKKSNLPVQGSFSEGGHQMHKHPSNSVRRREKKVRGSREGGISDGSSAQALTYR